MSQEHYVPKNTLGDLIELCEYVLKEIGSESELVAMPSGDAIAVRTLNGYTFISQPACMTLDCTMSISVTKDNEVLVTRDIDPYKYLTKLSLKDDGRLFLLGQKRVSKK